MRFDYQSGIFDLGRHRGTPIYLHISFFFAAVILTFPYWHRPHINSLIIAVLVAAVLFGSILVHELAHAEVARRYRIPAARIDINLYGGLVQFRREPWTTKQDALITLAGPLSNIALGAIAFAILWLIQHSGLTAVEESVSRYTPPSITERVLQATAFINFGLGIVNLFPGVPLDGGRLVYLFVENRWGSRAAIRTVGALGLVFASLGVFIFIGSALSGFPIWAPPEFKINWEAFNVRRSPSWYAYAV